MPWDKWKSDCENKMTNDHGCLRSMSLIRNALATWYTEAYLTENGMFKYNCINILSTWLWSQIKLKQEIKENKLIINDHVFRNKQRKIINSIFFQKSI